MCECAGQWKGFTDNNVSNMAEDMKGQRSKVTTLMALCFSVAGLTQNTNYSTTAPHDERTHPPVKLQLTFLFDSV